MEQVKKKIHAQAQEVFPYTGEGVTVAVLDSGMAMHPDLKENLAAFRDFVGKEKRPYDDSGHGTHVVGCMCGSGLCSGGRYAGIAPKCRIVACKVLDEKGEGDARDMMEAVSFCIRHRKLYGIKILSLSVGLNDQQERAVIKRLADCLEEACDAGILVIVAAGNEGPKADSMSPLGKSPRIISVGCYDGELTGKGRERGRTMQKNCAVYSGRGPDQRGLRKPDIVAPGTGIISCSANFKVLPGGRIKNPYTSMDGTSMAVPAVSGAAALLWQKYPDFTCEQIRNALLWSAADLHKPWNYQGWGLLDVQAALG